MVGHRIDAGQSVQQGQQTGRHTQDNACAHCGDLFCIATKLYRIAIALFSVQQNCLAVDVAAAKPQGFGVLFGIFRNAVLRPTGFVLLEAALKITLK